MSLPLWGSGINGNQPNFSASMNARPNCRFPSGGVELMETMFDCFFLQNIHCVSLPLWGSGINGNFQTIVNYDI